MRFVIKNIVQHKRFRRHFQNDRRISVSFVLSVFFCREEKSVLLCGHSSGLSDLVSDRSARSVIHGNVTVLVHFRAYCFHGIDQILCVQKLISADSVLQPFLVRAERHVAFIIRRPRLFLRCLFRLRIFSLSVRLVHGLHSRIRKTVGQTKMEIKKPGS